MDSSRPDRDTDPAPHSETNPLGGKIHLGGRTQPAHRYWSGYVAHVRTCPTCTWENEERALFCVSCATDIRDVPAIASSDSRPGVALIQKRLRREQRQQKRSRARNSEGGSGWIVFGAVVLLASVVIGARPPLNFLFWITAVASSFVGIWQIRTDPKAMRLSGIGLATSATLLLIFVGYRAIQASEAFDDPGNDPAIATPTDPALVQGAGGTPSVTISGSVPMYQGGPKHDGQMPGPAPMTSPSLAWQVDTGGELYGAPSLANGVLYVTSKTGILYAINAASGEELWQYEVTSYVTRSSPAVVDGVVYVGGGFSFTALDAETGARKWSTPLQYGGQASPTVHGGLVVVSSQEGWIYALRIKSGEIAWRIPTEGIVFGAAAFADSGVIYGTDEGILYNVYPETGTLKWRVMMEGAIYASPVVSHNLVYVTTQAGELFALDMESGKDIWSVDRGSAQPPAVNGDVVILTGRDGGVYGLDAATGTQRWLYPSGKQSLSAPAIAGDIALFGAGNSLLALDITSGEALWYYLAGDRIESAPVVAERHVFFGTRDGFLNAISDT